MPYVGSTLAPTQPPSIVLDMRNASFVGLNHRQKVWSIKANRVQIGRDRTSTTLAGISQGKIFDRGKLALQVEAGRAMYNSAAGDLMMDGGIKLSGSDGQVLTAKGASWNSTSSTLRSNGQVNYKSPWASASTKEMLVDMKNKEMTMRNVTLSVDLSSQGARKYAF